jgi:DnaJ-class molecular chaperone
VVSRNDANIGLPFDDWGCGSAHAEALAANTEPCAHCDGTGVLGQTALKVACPVCGATGNVTK